MKVTVFTSLEHVSTVRSIGKIKAQNHCAKFSSSYPCHTNENLRPELLKIKL